MRQVANVNRSIIVDVDCSESTEWGEVMTSLKVALQVIQLSNEFHLPFDDGRDAPLNI